MPKWRIDIKIVDDEIHLVPFPDAFTHDLTQDCLCEPIVEVLGNARYMVSHNPLKTEPID